MPFAWSYLIACNVDSPGVLYSPGGLPVGTGDPLGDEPGLRSIC